jgi:hypothetical protein
VLIKTYEENEHLVYNNLNDKDIVIEIKPLFTCENFDMFARIKTESEEQLLSFADKEIKKHYGVIDIRIIY